MREKEIRWQILRMDNLRHKLYQKKKDKFIILTNRHYLTQLL